VGRAGESVLRLRISTCRLDVRAALALMSLSLAVSCATQPESSQTSAPAPAISPVAPPPAAAAPSRTSAKGSKAVRASYQGNAQVGRRTASGEIYDPNDFTAASRTLPLGSSVIVTNPSTGRSVKVRINDRGPYVRGTSLDLSKRAAQEIGLTDKGVGRVKIKRAAKSETSESSGVSAVSTSTSSSSASSDR
jgi:rare lipoprotein A